MALTVEVDGNDLTDFLQDRSLSVKRNGADFTLIDPSSVPAVGDVVVITDPTWLGPVNSVEIVGYKGNVPFYKVRATNTDVLVDGGAAPFNLADTGTKTSSPAGFKDLSVQSQMQGSTIETRAKCIVYKTGLEAGMEIDITSVVHGYTAETFTIMDLTTEYPTEDGPTFTLDLGLGDFLTATTGADDGGPLDPIDLSQGIIDVVTDAGCCGDSGSGGSGGGDGGSAGITDTFTRTISPDGLGTADCGLTYTYAESDGADIATEVDGGKWKSTLTTSNSKSPQGTGTLSGTWDMRYDAVASVEFTIDSVPTGGSRLTLGGKLRDIYWIVYIDSGTSTFGFPLSTQVVVPLGFWVPGRTYTVSQIDDGTNTTNILTNNSGTTYTVPKAAAHTGATFTDIVLQVQAIAPGDFTNQTFVVTYDNLNIPEVTRTTNVSSPVTAESNAPAAVGGGGDVDFAYDTYYDSTATDITGDETLALANIGFTTDNTTFTATRAGLVTVNVSFGVDGTPGGACSAYLSTPDYEYRDTIAIANPNSLGAVFKGRTFWVNVGDTFKVHAIGTATNTPLTYLSITIHRISG